MSKLLLVDGHNLLFQMYYGMPNSVKRGGVELRGVIGFLGALHKILAMVRPTHAAVFFDSEDAGDRRALLPEYKANRPDWSAMPEEETPFPSLPYIYDALACEEIACKEIHGCEVDDVMAAYAKNCLQNEEMILSSWDSDYFQLVTDRVKILRYRGEDSAICDAETVEARCGVPPKFYADWKALVGDPSDNIRGADKVGPKTAAELIRTYGGLEEILAHKEQIARPKLRAAIAEAEERLLRNASLIRLSGDAPLPFSREEMPAPTRTYRTSDLLSMIGL